MINAIKVTCFNYLNQAFFCMQSTGLLNSREGRVAKSTNIAFADALMVDIKSIAVINSRQLDFPLRNLPIARENDIISATILNADATFHNDLFY